MLERGAVTTLKHPITVFIIAVCCVIGLGVAVLATTGNGGLSSALTCAPPTADQYGPPGAKFTSNFPGRVYLWPRAATLDVAPYYELCFYYTNPKARTFLNIEVRAEPQWLRLARPSKTNGITRFTTGDASGDKLVDCHLGICRGLVIVENRRFQWFANSEGPNARVVDSLFHSFRVTGS